MSYRAFKRLLGETSLERKCRFLLGGGIVVLITLSFWFYARQTEDLAYEQTTASGRLLVSPIVARYHLQDPQARKAMEEFQTATESPTGADLLGRYNYRFIKLKSRKEENRPDGEELSILNSFLADPKKNEATRSLPDQKAYLYYGAVRAGDSCIVCHNKKEELEEYGVEKLEKGALMGVMRVGLSTQVIERGVNNNRALLLSTALLTALLIMAGSYTIIRYVIVKPVKHLKEVSDAIAEGHLNVRSEIQTGDEFEDLSHAFNRMLRNLMAMKERDQKLNADLDRKVDELARANMALYESNRLKSDFLATVSHELRTPLHSIIGFCNVLLSANSSLNEKQARWVATIKSSGQQLLNLINEILDLAKIEAGKLEVMPEDCSLIDLCEGQLTMMRPQAEKKNIDLRGDFPSQTPAADQDPAKIRRIIANLLSNALKFTPEGGRVTLQLTFEGDRFDITVADTGEGIAEEHQELIFEKFRQAGATLERQHEGTGLGLSIVRELCRLLGGGIRLESRLGEGSRFIARLPLRYSNPEIVPESPEPEKPATEATHATSNGYAFHGENI